MKKVVDYLMKMDTYLIMFIVLIVCVVCSFIEKGLSGETILSLYGIPIFWYLFKISYEKKIENNGFDIDLQIKKEVCNTVLWKLPTDNSKKELSYICIKNTGCVNIFGFYFNVITHDNIKGCFRIDNMLPPNDECVIQLPYNRERIKEIVVSSSLQADNRTKIFNGTQSANEHICIFSNCERLTEEKHAVYHKNEIGEYERLERFLV